MAEVLYFDNQVQVYKELILINKYYFPLATSKTILFSEIETVALVHDDTLKHRWGVATKYMNNWFPYDGERSKKTKFIQIRLKGKKMRPSITPDDAEAVFKIIWENYTPEGRKYVQEDTERKSKETEVAQQQLMEQQKAVQGTEIHFKNPHQKIQIENLEE